MSGQMCLEMVVQCIVGCSSCRMLVCWFCVCVSSNTLCAVVVSNAACTLGLLAAESRYPT